MSKIKGRKYEARMRQRQEANAQAAAEARKEAEIAARPALISQIKADIIGLIKQEYGEDLPDTCAESCWCRLDVRFLAGVETPLYRVDLAFPHGGEILVNVTLKDATVRPNDTVFVKYHEYRGEPAPVSASDGTFDKYLLHENCSGYYD